MEIHCQPANHCQILANETRPSLSQIHPETFGAHHPGQAVEAQTVLACACPGRRPFGYPWVTAVSARSGTGVARTQSIGNRCQLTAPIEEPCA
jgi:hypothetical protein